MQTPYPIDSITFHHQCAWARKHPPFKRRVVNVARHRPRNAVAPPWPELGAPISPAVFGVGRTMENALAGHWAYLARLHVRQCQRI
jgi:hypothetical protein